MHQKFASAHTSMASSTTHSATSFLILEDHSLDSSSSASPWSVESTTPWLMPIPVARPHLNTDEVIVVVIEKLRAYKALKRLDEKIAEVEEHWECECPVPSEEEEEKLEQLWQLKKLEAKVWDLGERVLNLQRKLKGIQMEVDALQFSIDTAL